MFYKFISAIHPLYSGHIKRLPSELLRQRERPTIDRQRRHCQLRQVQVAATVLVFLRGVQVCGAESSEE